MFGKEEHVLDSTCINKNTYPFKSHSFRINVEKLWKNKCSQNHSPTRSAIFYMQLKIQQKYIQKGLFRACTSVAIYSKTHEMLWSTSMKAFCTFLIVQILLGSIGFPHLAREGTHHPASNRIFPPCHPFPYAQIEKKKNRAPPSFLPRARTTPSTPHPLSLLRRRDFCPPSRWGSSS